MTRELRESLAYDWNYNLFCAKTALPNIRNMQDRQIVLRWMDFLKCSNKTLDEIRLRNDFMYHLVLNVQEGVLRPPFDKLPPNLSLISMETLLPNDTDGEADRSTEKSKAIGNPRKGDPQLLRRSPDGGEFLLSQPIPEVGAFCYMAVVTKKKK